LVYHERFLVGLKSSRQHGDRLTMDENYKGHHIWSVPRQLPESRRWTSHVVINWTDGSRQVQTVFEVKRGFATQEEAEREGQTFAKKWIDDGKPKLRERGTGPGVS
jgi:hypothetical protein